MNPDSNTDSLSEPEDYTPLPRIFDLGVLTMNGEIPYTNLPIGTGTYHIAAADDPRLVRAVSSVACIADLRDLPAPVTGVNPVEVITHAYYANAPGGGNRFRWNATNPDPDNGGTVIRPYLLPVDQAGRWLAVNYNTGEADASQFGAHPTQTGEVNRIAIQKAFDSLPFFQGLYYTTSGRVPRHGSLFIPPGDYTIDQKLYFYSGARVYGRNWRCTSLKLQPGVYTDPANPVYVVEFEVSTHTDDPNEVVDINNHFGGGLSGIAVDCSANAGSSGLLLFGAQGTCADDIMITDFGVVGMNFEGVEIGTVWITGGATSLGPGLILSEACSVRSASIEHINPTNILGADGREIPYLLITGVGTSIDSLDFEASADPNYRHTFCRIENAHATTIRNAGVNGFTGTFFRITGDTRNFRIDSIWSRMGSITFIDDDAQSAGYTTGRPSGFHYVGNPQSYHSIDYVTDLAAKALDVTDTLTVKGFPVTSDVFTGFTAGHQRLRLLINPMYGSQSSYPKWLVHIRHGSSGKEYTFLVSALKPYQGNVSLHTTMLSGSGLLVNTTGATVPGGAVDPTYLVNCETTFSTNDANVNGYWVTVTALGFPPPNTSSAPYTWSMEPEPANSPAYAGTATGTLSAVTVDASGILPVNAVALSNLFTAAILKTDNYTLAATDPDIEADTSDTAFTVTLHSANNHAGLVRTISNVTPASRGDTLTLETDGTDTFTDGTTSHDVAPGESVRLKVNSTGDQFIIL